MHTELANSLQHLSTQIEEQLHTAESVLLSNKLKSVISSLAVDKKISSAVFAAYYQLVFSMLNEEDNLFEKVDDLLSMFEYRKELVFKDFDARVLGNEKFVSLYNFTLQTTEADPILGFFVLVR